MKNLYILLVIALLGVGGGVAFFVVKKKKDNKKNSTKTPILQPKEPETILKKKPVSPPTIENKTPPQEDINFDISISKIDTQNRRFDYSMHYQGIRHNGSFEDAVTSGIVQIKKGFGSFLIVQAMQAESSVSSKGAAQKIRGGKGATVANKTGKMGNDSIMSTIQNDLVVLSIIDKKGQTLKEVHVNLATGTQKSKNINRTVLRTI